MDGVLVNSNPFHVEKWIQFLKKRKVIFDLADVPNQILGKHNDDAFRWYFGPSLTREEMRELGAELESEFRETFRPHAKPLPGLRSLLRELRRADIPLAVVSSAIRANVEFIVDVLKLRPCFRCRVSGEDVLAPKPDPEIYLKAAKELAVDPTQCVAFEDSWVGIEAVKKAGMTCVAIASTFPAGELRLKSRADLVVSGFGELSLGTLRGLFSDARSQTGGRAGKSGIRTRPAPGKRD